MFLDFLRKSKEGLYIYIINVLNYINLTVDTFMGGLFLSLFDLGIYNITANIMRYVINAIPSSLSFFIFPLLLTKGKNEQEILKISLIIMNIFILPFVVASIYPEPFVKLISGGYEEYSNILFYFLPAVIVCSIQYIIVRYNLAKKDFSFIKVFALTALINVILNYVLAVYLNLGIHGLAMATTFSLVIFTFVLLRNFKIIEYEYVIKTFIVGILLSIITYAITFNMLRAFDNEAKAFLYGFFAIFISFIINLILIYLIFRNEAGNLKQKIFILLHKIKNYALRRFTTS
jgi:O-antigen/teichoic acid export membrane protein